MDFENVKQKIKKLINLATKNPNPNEAAAAMAKAQKLMSEYEIDQSVLGMDEQGNKTEEKEDPVNMFVLVRWNTQRMPKWVGILANGIAKINYGYCYMGCKTGGYPSIWISSTVPAFESIATMFHYLLDACEEMSETAYQQNANGEHKKQWRREFSLGFTRTVLVRLREQQGVAYRDKTEQYGIVRVERVLTQKQHDLARAQNLAHSKLNLRNIRTNQRYSNSSNAYSAGRAAGSRVNLGQGSTKRLTG